MIKPPRKTYSNRNPDSPDCFKRRATAVRKSQI